MNDYQNLTSSEKLIALLDGELQPNDSSILFYELAQSSELQEELRQQLAIKKILGNAKVYAPDHLKKKILIGTGLGTMLTATSAKLASNPIGLIWLNALKSKTLLMLISALIGSFATSLFMNLDSMNELQSISSYRDIPIISSIDNTPINSDESEGKKEILHLNNVVSRNTPEVESNTQVHEGELISSEPVKESINNEDVYVLVTIDNSKLYSSAPNIAFNNIREISAIDVFPLESNSEQEFYSKLALHVRGFATRSIPDVHIPPLDAPTLNNIALGLFYQFQRNLSIGIEAGQENFMQKYYGTDADGIRLDIEQNYCGFWTGISLQYDIASSDSYQQFFPFTRVLIGGTKVGPLLKGMFGLQYNHNNSFSIFSGVETTSLLYRFSGNTFFTHKLGFTFGGAVNF